ncbi:MAG: Metalloprotease LoiP [Nitrosomonadaceae bacterium]|nr:Metalloprotease LoiP [Nitrosomonadaceae bacterium]
MVQHSTPPLRRRIIQISQYFLCVIAVVFSCNAKADYWDVDANYQKSNQTPTANFITGGGTVVRIPSAWIRTLVETRKRIQAEAGLHSKLLFSDQPVANAWATSAGQKSIIVTLEMMELLHGDEAATASLLGHETAHLSRNHSLKTIAATTILDLLGTIAGAVLDAKLQTNGTFRGIGGQVSGLGKELIAAAYSREQEREADDYGTRWMLKLGYDPNGALRLHEKLLAASGNHDSFFASHPPTSERLASIRTIIAQYEEGKRAKQVQTVVVAPPSSPISPSRPAVVAQAPKPQPPATQSPSINVPKGEVGVVLTLKPRFNYVIFSGTTAQEIPVGTAILISGVDGTKYSAKVARAIEGYYSATVSGDVSKLNVGDRIEAY